MAIAAAPASAEPAAHQPRQAVRGYQPINGQIEYLLRQAVQKRKGGTSTREQPRA
jgi:hypothetical protein